MNRITLAAAFLCALFVLPAEAPALGRLSS
jgi:hypothetical protein